MQAAHDALRATLRMQLAFWRAQDRRSISAAPQWLWRGQLLAPLRETDLSPITGEKIRGRRRAGMPEELLLAAAGPRQLRLPRWATTRVAGYWAGAGAALLVIAAISAHASDDRIRVGTAAGWAAAGCAVIAAAVLLAALWARRDPLRLTGAEVAEATRARRVLRWNPLAGEGKVSTGGANLLEGINVCQQINASPAWALPGVDILRWRFDPEEEVFQIARAACALDLQEHNHAELRERGLARWAEQSCRWEHQQLSEALFERLVALHRCLSTLEQLNRRARRAGVVDDSAPLNAAMLGSAAENELAAAALQGLNTDLLGMVDGYEQAAAGGDPARF